MVRIINYTRAFYPSAVFGCLLIWIFQDRKLTHVNKKGRPVSQCPHCRGLRRARASHVKCDCGEKPHNKEDCEISEKGELAGDFSDNMVEISTDSGAPNMHICCCSHGARCVCSVKKGPLDPVPEVDYETSAIASFSSRMPRLVTAQSETALMVFANGHHKPAHKFNDAAHKSGLPYTIPIPHSVPGKSNGSREIGHRSTDSLPLLGSAEKSSQQFRESISSAQQEVRLVRSEHGSPNSRIMPNYEGYDSPIPPLDISNFPYAGYAVSSPIPDDYSYHSPTGVENHFSTPHDEVPPTLSAGLTSPVEAWSATDLPLGSSAYPRTYSQSASYTSFDHSNVGQPGLTTSSSGDVSEAGDYTSHYPLNTEQAPATSSEIPVAIAYPTSSGSPYITQQAATNPIDRIFIGNFINDIDTFLQTPTASPTELEEPNHRTSFSSDMFSRHGLTVQDAQKLAHSGPPSDTVATLSLQTSLDEIDPSWASAYTPDEVPYDQEDDPNFWADR